MPRRFPDGFEWGTATAAHQVEGGNWNNDWWAWEHAEGTPCVEPSGDACDQYHRYEEDIRLLAALGFGTYRFSIEWARIEPEEGFISKAELDHYRRVCATCLAYGIRPVVTFHHFTSPRWVAADGGWTNPKVVDRFGRYCERAVAHLGDLVDRACTINEPDVVAFVTYAIGAFPPGTLDKGLRDAAHQNFVDAHARAVEVLKSGRGDFPVGLTLSMSDYQAVPADDEAAIARRDRIRRSVEDRYLEAARTDDFIGVQTYSRSRIGPDGDLGGEEGVPQLIMGYEYYPEALAATIRRAWEVTEQTPILVTENGIGTDDDEQRIAYVTTALGGVLDCIDEGIDVGGYTYWSMLDNFEWAFGYGPRFGLIDVDRATQERRVKPSGHWLGAIARSNELPG
jgi:beta-glucosidase